MLRALSRRRAGLRTSSSSAGVYGVLMASSAGATPLNMEKRNPGIWVTPPSDGLPYLVRSRLEVVFTLGDIGFGNLHSYHCDWSSGISLSSKAWTLSHVREETTDGWTNDVEQDTGDAKTTPRRLASTAQ